jgi:hypothetical protein
MALLVAGCSAAPTVIPSKNLERPSAMAFACLGMVTVTSPSGDSSTVLSGLPMENCHNRTGADPVVNFSGQRNLGTFAFVANSSRNEMAVADMDRGRLLDLSPGAAGYGMLPVGGNPEALASSQDGCWVATANRSSCDLTLVDPSRLLVSPFSTGASQAQPATGLGDAAHRLVVQTGSGQPLYTATGEVAFLPSQATTCSSGAVPQLVATFPNCDMVALLNLSFDNATAQIINAYYVRPDLPGGFQSAGADPVCPTDCLAGNGDTGSSSDGGFAVDAGSSDGGTTAVDGGVAVAPTAYHLQPLALMPDGSRVYVGSLTGTAVTAFDLSAAGLGNPVRIDLAEKPIGVTRLRLGIDPYLTQPGTAPDGSPITIHGQFLTGRGSFLYAFAQDDSVRVVDIDGPVAQECDVNVLLPPGTPPEQKSASCFPVGSAPRRPLAQGPGIRIPTFLNPDSPPPLPRDIAFADLQPTANDSNFQALSGQFGFLLASNGSVYVINLAPQNGQSDEVGTATNSFRESRDVGQSVRTPIALSIAPQRSVVLTDQAFAATANFSASDGPMIKSFGDSAAPQWLDFPDPDTVISRAWDVTWEGLVPQTARESGRLKKPDDSAAPAVLEDSGADFCSKGVQTGDILTFPGCTQDLDCQPDDQYSCQVTVSGANGMCLPRDGAKSSALISQCARFMGSRMRYDIVAASPTQLTLGLKLDEVPKTALNPCTQDSDCEPDADHGLVVGAAAVSPRAFSCLKVHASDPFPRCVRKCRGDTDCRAGFVCDSVNDIHSDLNPAQPLCVEAPPLDPTCLSQPMTRYRVQAGKSFMVYGSSMPTLLHTDSLDSTGSCAVDPNRNPSLVMRIPLSAPTCPADFLAASTPVQTLPARAGYDPCLYLDSPVAGTAAGTVGVGTGSRQPISAFFQNPQIRFVLTNLDEYAGDLLSIHFELQYGFIPLAVQIPSYEVQVTLGAVILTGPTMTPESPIRRGTGTNTYPYVYVIDQGRAALTPGSRGQVLRINPRSGSNEIASFDTALSGNTPFQLQ